MEKDGAVVAGVENNEDDVPANGELKSPGALPDTPAGAEADAGAAADAAGVVELVSKPPA